MAKKKSDFGMRACVDISYKIVETCIENAKHSKNENDAYVFSGIEVVQHLNLMLPKLTAAMLKDMLEMGLHKDTPIEEVAAELEKIAEGIDADIAAEEGKAKPATKKSAKKSAAKKPAGKKSTGTKRSK